MGEIINDDGSRYWWPDEEPTGEAKPLGEGWEDVGYTTDDDLPGMWSRSDFEGGDPDERSYAERNRDLAADAVSLWPVAPADKPMEVVASEARFFANRVAVRRLEAYDDSWLADAVPMRFIAGIDQTEEDFDPALLKPSVLWQIPEPVTIEARNVSMEVMELLTGLPLRSEEVV